jgi:hypothetical protein
MAIAFFELIHIVSLEALMGGLLAVFAMFAHISVSRVLQHASNFTRIVRRPPLLGLSGSLEYLIHILGAPLLSFSGRDG